MLPFFTSCLQSCECIRPSCSHISIPHFLLPQEAMPAKQRGSSEAWPLAGTPSIKICPVFILHTQISLTLTINTAFWPLHQPTQTRMPYFRELLEGWVWLQRVHVSVCPPHSRGLTVGDEERVKSLSPPGEQLWWGWQGGAHCRSHCNVTLLEMDYGLGMGISTPVLHLNFKICYGVIPVLFFSSLVFGSFLKNMYLFLYVTSIHNFLY